MTFARPDLLQQLTQRPSQNWSTPRKLLVLFIVSFAGFSGMLQAVGNVSSIFQQGALYHKTPVEITYSVCHPLSICPNEFADGTNKISAATAGLCAGPLFWAPAAQKFGRTGCILWAMVVTILCSIWAAVSTDPGDYESFVVSRLFGCIFGSAATCCTYAQLTLVIVTDWRTPSGCVLHHGRILPPPKRQVLLIL